ncbi:MAG: carboxypeptidase-like regulatory domain-containing protein, partial [Pseudomonadota bacterium]|nr:carboxypeptidase-like regulatory domain-containing protein [Pseudomonadota bacterium]
MSASAYADSPAASGVQAIAGTVTGAKSVTVELSGPNRKSTTADANGDFRFADVPPGVHTVAPRMYGHVFTPASLAKDVGSAPLNGVNFSANPTNEPTYRISGNISGATAPGTTVTLNGDNVGSAGIDHGG